MSYSTHKYFLRGISDKGYVQRSAQASVEANDMGQQENIAMDEHTKSISWRSEPTKNV